MLPLKFICHHLWSDSNHNVKNLGFPYILKDVSLGKKDLRDKGGRGRQGTECLKRILGMGSTGLPPKH